LPFPHGCATFNRVLGRALAGVVVTLLLGFPSTAGAQRLAQPQIPLPSRGDVTVARLTLQAAGSPKGVPRLSLAGRGALPARTFAVATTTRSGTSRFAATVAIVAPRGDASAPSAEATKLVTLRLPSGYRLVGAPQVVRNALYTNRLPAFGLLANGTASVLGGAPPLLPLGRIVNDAQLLALDRSVPLAEMGLLGLDFVAVQLTRVGTTGLQATIGTSGLNQVSAVELRFPSGVTVSQVSGSAGTGTLRVGNPVQLVATQGLFQAGIPYHFTFRLSRPLKRGAAITVRASTHYFESSLPFVERFFVG